MNGARVWLACALLALGAGPGSAQEGEPSPKRLAAIRKDLNHWQALKARGKALGDRLLEVHADRPDAKARVGQLWGMLESIEAQIKARRRKLKESAATLERERRLERKELAEVLAKTERLEKLQLTFAYGHTWRQMLREQFAGLKPDAVSILGPRLDPEISEAEYEALKNANRIDHEGLGLPSPFGAEASIELEPAPEPAKTR